MLGTTQVALLLSTSEWLLDWGISMLSAIGVGYLLLVRLLRWRKYDAVHRRYTGRLNDLTVEEAQEIVSLASHWDMPFAAGLAGAIAFMKTLAIPSTSKVLVQTGEMRSEFYTSKRLVDTSILIDACPLGKATSSEKSGAPTQLDPRAYLAIARVNWLHRKYNISNDDYLYTLSIFVLEFLRLAKRYGWRCLSPLECQSRFVVWREIGTLIGIRDIPETFEGFEAWAQAFEELHMIPAPSNHQCAEATLSASEYRIPNIPGLKALARSVSICILDDRMRTALMLPEPPRLVRLIVDVVLRASAFVQGHLCLPRRSPVAVVSSDIDAKAGEPLPRQRPKQFSAKPWYKPEPKGISAIMQRIQVALGWLKREDVPGPMYRSQGYLIEQLGPVRYENVGQADVIREAGEMMGCPLGVYGGSND